MSKGFTLIELLVVVLIIGILAAVALPQYTKAVERSRTAEAAQLLGDLATAQSIYYMQHNGFAQTLSDLNAGDITLSAPSSTWTLNSTAFTGNATTASKPQAALMTMTRDGGMYGTSTLQLKVDKTGAITKCFSAKDGTTGFDSMAATAGYTQAAANCAL